MRLLSREKPVRLRGRQRDKAVERSKRCRTSITRHASTLQRFNGSQSARVVKECPRKFEFVRQMFRQRLNSKRFCRIMAAIENVQTQFLSERKCPMGPFAGDERVHAFARRLFQFAARAASHHPDAPANIRSAGQQLWRRLQRLMQSSGQFLAFQTSFRFETNESAFLEEKRLPLLQGQR